MLLNVFSFEMRNHEASKIAKKKHSGAFTTLMEVSFTVSMKQFNSRFKDIYLTRDMSNDKSKEGMGSSKKSCSKGILESCGLPGAKRIFAMEY